MAYVQSYVSSKKLYRTPKMAYLASSFTDMNFQIFWLFGQSVSQQPKMSVIGDFIVVSLVLNEFRSNLVKEVKIRSLFTYIAQKVVFFIVCCKQENFDSDFGHFLAKHVLNIGLPWQQLTSLVTKKYTK